MNKVIESIKNYYSEYLLVSFFLKVIVLGGSGFADVLAFGILIVFKCFKQYLDIRKIEDKAEIQNDLTKTHELVRTSVETNRAHIEEEIDKLRGTISTMKINLGLNQKSPSTPFQPKSTGKSSNGQSAKAEEKQYF